MNITDIHKKIISKEPYNDTSVFLASYESFEEIPVVSRYSRLEAFKKELGYDGVRDLLITLAIFLLNTALIVSRSKGGTNTFFAITFTSFDRYDEDKFIIPKIFIYPGAHKLAFPEKLRQRSCESSRELSIIDHLFKINGAGGEFEILESRFHDPACNEKLVRVYVIPKNTSL